MKELHECKEYFKDIYTDCLTENAFEKSIFESTERARYEMQFEVLEFIYGKDFKKVVNSWQQEALHEFFKK